MDKIYSTASKIIISPGAQSYDSDIGMGTLERLHQERQQNFNLLSLNFELLQAISNLLRREWWRRVWVIQEAMLSQNPVA